MWPRDGESSFYPFVHGKLEMSIEQGCLVWGGRLVIPSNLRRKALKDLHKAQPSLSCIKALRICYLWWPGIDLFCTVKRAKLIKQNLRKSLFTIGKEQKTHGSDFI